jgi:hypothetical protein
MGNKVYLRMKKQLFIKQYYLTKAEGGDFNSYDPQFIQTKIETKIEL